MHTELLFDLQSILIAIAVVTPRTYVLLSILPGFGAKTLTGIARGAVAISIALPAMVSTFFYVRDHTHDILFMTFLSMKEAFIGLMLGTLLSIPIWVAQSIGGILDAQRMPIQVQANNASIDQDASALGGLLLQALIVVMIQAGLFFAMARIIMESYALWPAHSPMPPFETGQFAVLAKKFGEFFWHIVVYGAPVLIPLIMIDFGFAILGVFASGLQVSFASAPIKSLVGLVILLPYWPTFSHYVANDFSGTLDLLISLFQAATRP
jgi:type III secretion protein T